MVLPVALFWGAAALAAGVGASLPIIAAGNTVEKTGEAANKAAPVVIMGVALGAYLILRK